MLGLRQYFLNAMTDIEESQRNGHLLGPETFVKKHKQEKDYLNKTIRGSTTNPLFEMVSYPSKSYRVKPDISASKAIKSLLEDHETFVECGVALNIAYYLVVLRKMEEKLGGKAGRKRFDMIFGESDRSTPISRRLIISPSGLLMGTIAVPEIEQLPVQPLSYFITVKDVGKKSAINKNVQIGWQIIFAGDPNYGDIHPAGHHGAYNCVVTSIHPLKVRAFDLGTKELLEEELYELHKQAYGKEPSFESFCLLDRRFRTSDDFLKMTKNPTNSKKIPGFVPQLVAVDEEKLNFLLSGEIEDVTKDLDKYIHTTYKTVRNEYLENRRTDELMEKLKQISLKGTESVATKHVMQDPFSNDSKVFSGLKGLRGAFTSKPPKKNCHTDSADQSNSSTVTHQDVQAFAGLTNLRGAFVSKKEKNMDFFPSFTPGFLIKNEENKKHHSQSLPTAPGINLKKKK